MLRVLSELLWAVRREGVTISTAQAIEAARATELVGWSDRGALRDALVATTCTSREDAVRLRRAFDAFFDAEGAHAGDLFHRLARRGFGAGELAALRELLDAVAERSGQAGDAVALRPLTGHPGELDHLLAAAGVRRVLAGTQPRAVGFFAQRALESVGVPRAASALGRLARVLRESFGDERGDELARALEDELAAMRRRIRAHVERLAQRDVVDSGGARPPALDVPFADLSPDEARHVRRAVRTLAEKLRGGERVRRKRARRGRIDVRRTMRAALATGGVPFRPARRVRRRDKPRIVMLCDVSESVRSASRFLLELLGAVQELFADARSFVFVSDVAETTALFRAGSLATAFAAIGSGRLISLAHNSNYQRALAGFWAQAGHDVDRRTTVVILGDGRTNHHGDAAEVVARLKQRARRVIWLCPEPRSAWGGGDSAMWRYAAAASEVVSARTARELEDAARKLVRGA
jgi:uncharacterized protein with von Willebrand factor type A (vWA) domain